VMGMGMPGWCDYQRGVLYQLTNVRVWDREIPVKEMMEQALGLPVVLDNDANCMAYAEWKLGAGRGMSDLMRHYMAGQLAHARELTYFLAPYVNSYRRYVPDFAAPINLEWGRDNRTTGLRVPISGPEARRVENRLAGMDCNPYLGLAASLACGYLGLVEGKDPRPECLGDAYISEDELPLTLGDALDIMVDSAPMREVLGQEFVDVYESVKRNEYKEFLQVISPWEREHLLLNV